MRHLYATALIIASSLFNSPLEAPEASARCVQPIKVMYHMKQVDKPVSKPVIVVEQEPEPKGRWITVIATAYSPKDKIDKNHPHCKDDFTASMTRISKNPYGVAVPMRKDRHGRSSVPVIADYGTTIYIPSGYGYLDKSRREDRIFVCDDTGGVINSNTRRTGIPHIDLRFKSETDAKKFGKKKIEIFVYDE